MAIYHNRLAIVPETAQSGKKFFHHGLHGLLWIITGSNQFIRHFICLCPCSSVAAFYCLYKIRAEEGAI